MAENNLKGAPQDWYSNGYRNSCYSGILGYIYSLVHKLMEQPFKPSMNFEVVLEVGAGNGEHLPYVKHNFKKYFMTDIRLENLPKTNVDSRVVFAEADSCALLEFHDNSVDRLIATCLLVHVNEPLNALVEWNRVVKPGGTLTIYLAPEPGILVTVIRRLFIWPKYKRKGAMNPKLLAYSEHRNHYPGMITYIEEVFKSSRIVKKRFPTKFIGWNFSIFEIVHIYKM